MWAGMFYLFPAMIARWESDFGWSKTDLAGAFTAALVVSAFGAPLAGRLIDKGHGRVVMVTCAAIGGVMVGSLSLVETLTQFYAIWLIIGFSMAGCLYEPCFALLTHFRGLEAKRAITAITLVAGFAGTVSFPTANILAEFWGWRAGTWTFGAGILFIAVPLFLYGGRARSHGKSDDEPDLTKIAAASDPNGGLRNALRHPAFWLLAIAFPMITMNHGVLLNHLLPMLGERGVSIEISVLAASTFGPMQVAGRLGMMALEKRVSMQVICAFSFVFMAVASLFLFFAGASTWLIFAFVMFQGSGYGVTSITRPTVTVELLGRTGFGAISGALAMPFMAAFAAAPTLAAVIWSAGGYSMVIIAAIGMVVVGFLAFVGAVMSARTKSP